MTKFYSKCIISLAAVSMLTISAGAATITTTNGLIYTYNSDKTEVTLTGVKSGYTIEGDITLSTVTSKTYGVIPVVGIDTYVLYSYTGITSVTCGDKLTSIGNYALGGCTALTKVEMPAIEIIKAGAFRNCSALTSVTIGDNLTTLGNVVFQGTALKEITLPASLTSLGYKVFSSCSDLKSITCKAVTPPTIAATNGLYTLFANEDYSDYEGVTLYVPAESIEAYKAADGWSAFGDNIVAIPEDNTTAITTIEADLNDAPVEYYNLQGVRIENPTNGLYIRRQGKTASKVLVK